MVVEASATYPHLSFHAADVEDANKSLPGPFDANLITDTPGSIDDCQRPFDSPHHLCTRDAYLVADYCSHLWYPALKIVEKLGMHMPQNVLASADIRGIAELANFELMKSEIRLVSSVIVPARNKRGNIEPAVRRIPRFTDNLEIIFVEGQGRNLGGNRACRGGLPAVRHQDDAPAGPWQSAVFSTMDRARGDVLIILDADLPRPPELLPKSRGCCRNARPTRCAGRRSCAVATMRGCSRAAPSQYANRAFDETRISRFRHGVMPLRMALFASLRVKAM